MKNPGIIEISMTSRVEYLSLLHAACDEICRILELDEDTSMNMSLALHEAAINAMKHGNGFDESKVVTVSFEVRPDRLIVKVKDEGEGFDWAQVKDPRAPENIGRTNGRGIFLMRSFVDSVDYERVPGGGLVVSMVKNLEG
ncbi:MAG TPA: ATP-binding protein [Candidatus Saccharimonadales bacterium]|nr:ATP-binding protein [Candidatus Saccharimonadales bacterium]